MIRLPRSIPVWTSCSNEEAVVLMPDVPDVDVMVMVAVGDRVAVSVGREVNVAVLVGIVTDAGIRVAVRALVGMGVSVMDAASVDVETITGDVISTLFPSSRPK
jgi:hypothetical protein